MSNGDDLLNSLGEDGSKPADDSVDLLDELDEAGAPAWRLEEDADGNPIPGQGLQGTVVGFSSFEGDFGEVPIVTLRQKDGAVVNFFIMGAILKDEYENADPQVGDTFAAKFFGTRMRKNPKKNEKPMNVWRVAVRKSNAQPAERPF